MAPKAWVWRRKSEGLQVTSKGSKDLAGGKCLHLMVAVAYHQGVILKEQYEKLNGKFFANFIRRHFNLCFARAGPKKDGKRIFVQDNDPSMVSKAAMTALHEIVSTFQTAELQRGYQPNRRDLSHSKGLARRASD